MTPEEKVRENRLRRMADRQGLKLRKSGRRDPHAYDYGVYHLVDDNYKETGRNFKQWSGRDLDDLEKYLTSDRT